MEKSERMKIANKFIEAISEHGRRFFYYEGRVGKFIMKRGQLYWFCEWKQKPIYLGYQYWKFHHGGTLRDLVNTLACYIRGNCELPLNQLGPWPDWMCGGDVWGYGDEMEKVREKCNALGIEAASSEGDIADSPTLG